ncbi:hypothetical protein [Paenibacillus sp. FSL R7-0331]|uniref:hypothetical protein n=1 Tax=Paenibacillus sp. FSL R7-0331 TaxID=1536773 RepID=UPI0004F71583|nr:hypothetical protein [Paenibacillus sp. FSL R7-0331]AIQ51297.1 hypothetical protein R70331_07090 [Paenibacillus sp. FSL R7-0331]
MHIKLPMKYPALTCYPNHANLLSVISQNDRYTEWFLNNYVQLFVDKNDYKKKLLRLDFYTNNPFITCPFISHQHIHRNIIKRAYDDIVEFLIHSLEEGYYIYLIIDSYYISKYAKYQVNHQVHDLFIYGIDTERSIFYAADNFTNGKYSYEEIPLDQIRKAYDQVENLKLSDWLEGVKLIGYREANEFWALSHTYKFDLQNLLIELEEYLNGSKTPVRYANPYDQWYIYACEMAFGQDIFDVIIHFITYEEDLFDKRPLFVLWEHKKVMLMRLRYLEEKNYLTANFSDAYAKIEHSAYLLNKMYLKHFVGGSRDIEALKRIAQKLEEMKQLEAALLRSLLQDARARAEKEG